MLFRSKGNDSLIIEKKEYPAVEFAAEENEEKLELKTGKVLASLELSSGRIEWKHADGTRLFYDKFLRGLFCQIKNTSTY